MALIECEECGKMISGYIERRTKQVKDWIRSYRLGNDEYLPIIKCKNKAKGNTHVFLKMKEAYEALHKG